MANYPLIFTSNSSAGSGLDTIWTSYSPGQIELKIAIPPEFEGVGGGFSPEDLYIQALVNCFVATFKFAAQKSNLDFIKLEVNAKLVVDHDESKRPFMKELFLDTKLFGPSHLERAKRLLNKIESSCLILNSVKTKTYFNHEVTE